MNDAVLVKKAISYAILMAVPRPFIWWLGDVCRGWRKLLRAAMVLALMAYAAAILGFCWLLLVAYLEAF